MHLLRLWQVCAQTGLSRSALYEQIKKGLFPKAVRISTRSVAWRSTDIDSWIGSRQHAERSESIPAPERTRHDGMKEST